MSRVRRVPPGGGEATQAEAEGGSATMAPSVRGRGGSVAVGDVGGGAGEGGGYYPAPPPVPFSRHHLEVTVISAQDLYPAARSMRTYAVAYFRPDHRARTRIDASGHTDPTWNDKFVFRVDDAVLHTSAITIDVYAARPGLLPGPDILLGTARAILSTLRPSSTTHYAALQIRRPASLRPQGILNLGVALVDPCPRSVPVHADRGHASSTPRPDVPKPKRSTAGTSRAADRERTELERKLKKWRAELPPVSGEVVRPEKGGRNRGAPVAAVVEDEPVIRWQRIRSFKRFACFGGGNVESGEFVAAPRYVEERPPRRTARDAVHRHKRYRD
ncbi:C2 domain containing protein [Musa troglodytarum]|uniref:C2 domain containing protein n=1 Tax=Musa troglodytarum TaxID=320322 RepID=A0A9E7EUB8_9LILI|nr:C2 domain containing protein [Musa troglodytarum]